MSLALFRCVHSGIEMHSFPNTPTERKKQCPLKEVLTLGWVFAQCAPSDKSTTRSRDNAKSAAAVDVGICQRRRKRLCLRHFLNSHSVDRCANVVALSRRRSRNAVRRSPRVATFGNEKIFVGKMVFASPRWSEPDFRTNRRTGDSVPPASSRRSTEAVRPDHVTLTRARRRQTRQRESMILPDHAPLRERRRLVG